MASPSWRTDLICQALLDEWLKPCAVKFLLEQGWSLEVMAAVLACMGAATCRRAFKRWLGMIRRVYLRQHGVRDGP